MAPKKGKAADKSSSKPEEESDEPLQAVVFADSFETRFAPFTLETPRCLLPLANIPLIEYTLEFLAGAGVDEVHLFCGNHTEQVEHYLSGTKWRSIASPFESLKFIRSQAHSIGEAMRDLDKRAELVNDFFVVYGDIISNMPLETALAAHKKRRATDKNSIMTMVLRETNAGSESRRHGAPVFVLDPRHDRCLHYEAMRPGQEDKFVGLEAELLKDFDELDIRADLLDCGIDICTPDVLALWTDNFDFQTPRQNFLYSVLKDYELNGKKIHTHVVGDHYAARVQDLRSYDAVSTQVISRWAYPLCPESNLVSGQTYQFTKGFRYKENNIFLARSCNIGPKTVIGADTRIGDGSVIINSVIGRRVAIGENVRIQNAYIWDDVIIRDGVKITQSVVASGASIGKHSTLEPGTLISYNVQITENMIVPRNSRITRMKRKSGVSGDQDDIERVAPDPSVVGANGDGALYAPSDDDEDEDDSTILPAAATSLLYNPAAPTLDIDTFSDMSLSDSDSDSDASSSAVRLPHRGIPTSARDRSSASSFLSIASDDTLDAADAAISARRAHDFHAEAVSGLLDSLARKDSADNVALELTSLRMTAEASPHAVRKALAAAFVKHILQVADNEASALPAAVRTALAPYKTLFARNVFDADSAAKTDQVDLLLCVQAECARRAQGDTVLLRVAHELVGMDVVEAEGVEQWWGDARGSATEEMGRVREKTRQLVEFLTADEDESSEEESSEEE